MPEPIQIVLPQPIEISIESTNPVLQNAITQIQQQMAALQQLITQFDNYQPADADLEAIAQIATTVFGRSLLTLVDATAAKQLLQIPAIVDSPDDIGAQPADSDLAAIAQLITTSFGRSLLTLTDAAAARDLLQVAQTGGQITRIYSTTSFIGSTTSFIGLADLRIIGG